MGYPHSQAVSWREQLFKSKSLTSIQGDTICKTMSSSWTGNRHDDKTNSQKLPSDWVWEESWSSSHEDQNHQLQQHLPKPLHFFSNIRNWSKGLVTQVRPIKTGEYKSQESLTSHDFMSRLYFGQHISLEQWIITSKRAETMHLVTLYLDRKQIKLKSVISPPQINRSVTTCIVISIASDSTSQSTMCELALRFFQRPSCLKKIAVLNR